MVSALIGAVYISEDLGSLNSAVAYASKGFTRYPTFMDKNYIAWLKGDALLIDPDLEDIRGVCSFYCHGDSLHRSQLLAVVTSIPWLLIDHTIAFGVSFLYFLFSSCKKHICRRHFDTQCINNAMYTGQIIKNIAALISIIFYYVSWILGANLVKAIITVGIVANQNLYQAILFRKGYADFLTSFAFGNVIAITTVEGVKKEFETDSESDSDSDSDEETATVRAQNLVLESDQSPEIVSELKQTAWESEHDSSLGNEGNSFDPGILHWIRGLVKEDDTRSMIGDITSSFFRSNTESKSGVEKGVEKKRKRMNHRGIEVDDDNDDSVLKGIGENKEQEASSFDEAIEDEGAIPVEDSEDIEAGIEVDFDTFQRPEPENTKPSSVISAFKSIKRRIENEFFSGRKLLYSANQKSADKKTECTPNNQLANDNNPIVPVDKHSAVAIDTTDTFGDATDDASLTLVLDGIHHFSRSISTESTQGRDKTDMSTEDFIIQHFSTMSPTMRSTSFFQQPSKDSHSGSLSLSASATNSPTKKAMAFFHNPINDDSLVSLPDGRGDNKNSPTDRFIIHPDGSIHPIPEPSIEDLLVEQSIGDHHSLGDREDTESYTGGEKASIMDQSHIVTVEASLASSLEKNKSNGSPCNNRKVEEIHQNLSLKDLEKGLQLDFIPEAVKSNLSIGSTLDDNDAFAIATNRDEAGLVSTRRCDQFIF